MKNKRYRELAAILVMMTMTAGSITTVAAETETTAEEETTAETETDEPETETAEDAEQHHIREPVQRMAGWILQDRDSECNQEASWCRWKCPGK